MERRTLVQTWYFHTKDFPFYLYLFINKETLETSFPFRNKANLLFFCLLISLGKRKGGNTFVTLQVCGFTCFEVALHVFIVSV